MARPVRRNSESGSDNVLQSSPNAQRPIVSVVNWADASLTSTIPVSTAFLFLTLLLGIKYLYNMLKLKVLNSYICK